MPRSKGGVKLACARAGRGGGGSRLSLKRQGGGGVWEILLPSAVHLEERLIVSQAVPEPGQQSVRQKHTVWVFCQWQTRDQAVGTLSSWNSSSGRMVMQLAAYYLVGGSNPGRMTMPPAPPLQQRVPWPGFEPPTSGAASCYVTIRPAVVC